MGLFDYALTPNAGGILGGFGGPSYDAQEAEAARNAAAARVGRRRQPEDPNGPNWLSSLLQSVGGATRSGDPLQDAGISTMAQYGAGMPGFSQAAPQQWMNPLASMMPQSGQQSPAQGLPPLSTVQIPPVPGVGQPQPPQQRPGAPLDILPQQDASLPPNAQLTHGQAPQMQPQGGGFNPLNAFGNGLQDIAAGFSPGIRVENRPTLQKTGTDPFTGQDTFAWVNPNSQTMTQATMGGRPSGTGNAPGGMGQFADAVRAGVGGEQLMKLAPPEIKNRLQAMLDGREAPPTQAGLRNPQVQALLNAAHSIDPSFDETKWGVRFAQRKNYEAGGKQFQEAQALNTVSGHLVNLMKSADALDNTSIPIVNGVMNWLRQNTGDPRVDKLNTDVHAVTSELSKAYKAGHVSDSDVRAWNNNINSAKSPEQFKAVIGELNDLLRSKRETLDEGYRSAMGKTPMPAEYSSQSERSNGNFDSVADWSLGGKKPSASPSAGWSVKKL